VKRTSIPFEEVFACLLKNPKVREGYEQRRAILALGRQIAAVRARTGLTQAEVATRCDLSAEAMAHLEAGMGERTATERLLATMRTWSTPQAAESSET
jgi:DNA-binding XRE family transcriptional regulator